MAKIIDRGQEPYTMNEIKSFLDEDLDRIEMALREPKTQIIESRYYFSGAVEQLVIQQYIARRVVRVHTWQEAEKLSCVSQYFSGIEDWPVIPCNYVIKYSGDIRGYYEKRGISTWEQAKDKGQLPVYFSGIGLFPKVEEAYKVRIYSNDYDAFLAQLTYVEYLSYLRDYSTHVPARWAQYDDPRKFYQTAMSQIQEYIDVLRDVAEPVYIPGDGLGIGSYVCMMMGKRYFSTEPNEIGRDARRMGIISSSDKYSVEVAKEYATVFFGNCVHEIYTDLSLLSELTKKTRVIVYDEQGLSLSKMCSLKFPDGDDIVDYVCRSIKEERHFFVGTSYKAWYSWKVEDIFSFRYMDFYRRDIGDNLWLPVDSVSESVLQAIAERDGKRYVSECKETTGNLEGDLYALLKDDVMSVKYYKEKGTFKISGDKKDLEKLTICALDLLRWYRYPAFVRLMRNRSDVLRLYSVRMKKNVVYVAARECVLSSDVNIVSLFGRSFLQDKKHAKVGSLKFVGDGLHQYYPGYKIISDTGWSALEFQAYDRADTLEVYEQIGQEFIARVKNPFMKQFIRVNDRKIKVVLVHYDDRSNIARYRLVQSLIYDNDLEIVDG
jgi:hypothetical protein